MKDLKKQLMAAIAMTLVAAIALGSSTYAWFAANGSATATGINVVATAESAMSISKDGYNSGFGSSAVMVNERHLGELGGKEKNFTPVEHVNNTEHDPATSSVTTYTVPGGDDNTTTSSNADHNFHALDAESLSKVKADGKVSATPSFVNTDSGYFRDTVWLRAVAGSSSGTTSSDMKVFANVVIADGREGTENIVKALRVAIVDKNGKLLGCCKGSELIDSEGAVNSGYTSGTFTIKYGDGEIVKDNKITVYTWIEGNDDECKNSNAMDAAASTLSNIPIKISFKKVD